MSAPHIEKQTADQPTETTPETLLAPTLPEVPATRTAPDAESEPAEDSEVTTPGGLPMVPAVTVGTTGTIAAISSAGLAAGPVAALAATAAVVVGTAAVAVARAPRLAGTRTYRPRSAAAARRTAVSGSTSHARRMGTGALQRATQRAAAVRQARRQGAANAVSKGRTAAATDTTRARRAVADARREARQRSRTRQQPAPAGRGGRVSLAKGATAGSRSGSRGGLWRAGRRAAAQTLARARRTGRRDSTAPARGRDKGESGSAPRGFLARRRAAYRQARDGIRDRWRAQKRARIEERARNRARTRALRRSAARHHARRALAVLLATPLGLLSLALWPVARLLRVRPPRWGRAVWRGLSQAAGQARAARDAAARQEHDQAEAERVRQERSAPGDVDRTRAAGSTTTTTITEEPNMFDFREATADMLAQAQSAEPGGMMHVLASIENLPEAMASIAETFAAVAATCSPENMPLHPAVTDALTDLHKQLVSCVDAAEAVGEAFHAHHEDDIARHTDGRTAEEMWDVTRNQD